jgi:type IV secretion system protein VirB8
MGSDKFNPDEALNYEATKSELLEKSNKRAWFIAGAMTIVSICLGVAISIMMPLKTFIPYMIKVDKNGMEEVVYSLQQKEIDGEEALDKYWVGLYTKKRESYYYNLLEQDYIAVQEMSSDNIARTYRKKYDGDNALDKKYEDKREIKVNVKSIVLGESAGSKTASIRIELIDKDLITNRDPLITSKVISLSYDYYPQVKQNESQRLINPLVFKVNTYRIDNEVN